MGNPDGEMNSAMDIKRNGNSPFKRDSSHFLLALKVAQELRNRGKKAYFAGGCVRDALLGYSPVDYDIATDALPGEVMGIFRKTIPVGIEYGVVLVVEDGVHFEVATFRKDGRYIDGRHPGSVEFSKTAREDVRRRDFTINGLLYDTESGEVLDYVGGRDDIRRKIIRAIGEPQERFKEDKLRLMRAVRFAARYGYEIEDKTLDAIKSLAEKISEVSPERLRDELDKIIRNKNPGAGLQMLQDAAILKHVLPEISCLVGVEQPEEFHPEGDVFIHTKMMLDLLKNPSRVLAFSVLLHDVGKPKTFARKERIRFDGHVTLGAEMADGICRRLRFSNEEREKIIIYIENHLKFMDVKEMREAKLKRFMQSDTFLEELELHRVDCLASHCKLDNWDFCRKKLEEYSKEELKPIPIINGDDLIGLGFKPGPLFKEILNRVGDLQLENKLATKDAALIWVKENYPQSV